MSYRDDLLAVRRNGKASPIAAEPVKVVTGADLLRSPKIEVPMLVDGLLTRFGISILAGMSDLGKSAFARQLATYIVTGQERFCGFKLNATNRKVIFVSSEDDESATCALLHRICDDRFTPDMLEGLRFIFEVPERLEMVLKAELDRQPADLIVVDCLMDFAIRMNANQANESRAFLNPFKKLAMDNEAHIMFLHHMTKRSDEREPNKSNLMGSGAWEHAPRTVLELREGDTPDSRYLCLLKANYVSKAEKEYAYELKFDQMRFTAPGTRKHISELVRRSNKGEQVEQAKALAAAGVNQREIGKQLGIGLGTVNKYVNM